MIRRILPGHFIAVLSSFFLDGNKLSINVDGKSVPVKEYRLQTHDSQALLRTRLEFYKTELRFWYDGQKFTPKFGTEQISEFRLWHDGVKFEPVIDKYAAQRGSKSEALANMNSEQLREMHLMEKIRVTSRPEGVEGRYEFEADPELCEYVKSQLTGLNKQQYVSRKGTFGEKICARILSEDWELRDHPGVKVPRSVGCHRPGPDSQLGPRTSSESYLFEFKWWKNPDAAAKFAREQVEQRYRRDQRAVKEVKGAYIGILDWDVHDTKGSLEVKKVWSGVD